jgi:hypothetical protein
MIDKADCELETDSIRAHTARVAEVVLEPLHVHDIAEGKVSTVGKLLTSER